MSPMKWTFVRNQRKSPNARCRSARSRNALVDEIAGIVDNIVIVAGKAAHRVGPGSAIEHVLAGVAHEQIVKRHYLMR